MTELYEIQVRYNPQDAEPTHEEALRLAHLVESHRQWAAEQAAILVATLDGFDEKRFALAATERRHIADTLGGSGLTAHTALYQLLLAEGRKLGAAITEAEAIL